MFEIILSGREIFFRGFGMKTVTSHQLVGVLSANKRRARAKTSSPGISSTSPDSTSAILRRTSASCALVISGETSSARLPINRSANSARTSGESVVASRKISSDVAMLKDYASPMLSDKLMPAAIELEELKRQRLRLIHIGPPKTGKIPLLRAM